MVWKYLVIFVVILVVLNIFYFIFSSWNTSGDQQLIQINESGFQPRNVEIKIGDKVVFENIGELEHWPASNIHPTHSVYSEFDPKKGIKPGGRWEFTFDRVGSWRMHDHLFPENSGLIRVIDDGSDIEKKNIFENLFDRILSNRDKLEGNEYNDKIKSDDVTISENKNALYSYVKKFGPKKAVEQLAYVDNMTGANCHDDAHLLGKYAFEVYGNETFGMCSAECHSGCYHGATEAFFKENGTENLQNNLSIVCGGTKNSFFNHQCLHGVGHGLMAWSDYEIHDALRECDALDQGQQSCYSGVFMENIVGALASGDRKSLNTQEKHYTKYLNNDPHFPCTVVDQKYRNACYFYQTSRMVQLLNYDFSRVAEECGSIESEDRQVCFESMGRDIGGFTNNEVGKAIKLCMFVDEPSSRIDCMEGAVQNSFWDPAGQNTAVSFCKALSDIAEKEACYDTIIERAGQVLETTDHKKKFCGNLENNYIDRCNGEIIIK